MTLIELLVVIIILTTIVAAAIPIMTPADNDRQLREASRALNTFITSAQARAIALNRPVGIALMRLSQTTQRDEDRGGCVQVYYVEEQPPFSGFDPNSAVMVAFDNGPNGGGAHQVLLRFVVRGGGPDPLPAGTIRPGDVVEVNGTRYRLADTDYDPPTGYYRPDSGEPNGTLVAVPVNGTGQMLNVMYDNDGHEIGSHTSPELPFYTSPAPYKIYRQAMPTSDEPFQLPEGTAIDLRASGVGSNDYFYWPGVHDNPQGIMILFSPEGTVSRVSFSQLPNVAIPFDQPVVDNVYLLVGNRENVPQLPAADDPSLQAAKVSAAATPEQKERLREKTNWLRGTSRWIVIGSQTGRIATVANSFVDLPTMMTTSTTDPELRRTEQIVAARELTRMTTQETGR
jgi:type II secretory pathway pseudopilin PulG